MSNATWNTHRAEYAAWWNLKAQCKRESLPISEDFQSFNRFVELMGLKPRKGLSLQLTDAVTGFTLGNVSWARKQRPKKEHVRLPPEQRQKPAPSLKLRYPKEYAAWRNMRAPCSNPKHPQWASYGGAGIKVCPAWQSSFEKFLTDLGPRPGPTFRLSREDLTRDFDPENTRWEPMETWGVLKGALPASLPRADAQLLSMVAKVTGVRPSMLLVLLDKGLTTRDLLRSKLPSSTSTTAR